MVTVICYNTQLNTAGYCGKILDILIEHGFPKDRRRHSVDLRIVFKNGDIMIRFKDDCKPFDPQERQLIMTPEDPAKNIGLRIVFRIAKEHSYQNLLGLNVLTVKL